MKGMKFLPLGIAIALLGMFAFALIQIDKGEYNPKALESALIGKPVPAFNLEDVHQPGRMLTNADIKGEVALVNVWATWCPSCKYEHQFLMNLARRNIVSIIGVNYRDERDLAIKELKMTGNPYTLNIYDKAGRLGLDLGVYGAPETYIIDENGIVQYRYAGPIDARIFEKELLPVIERLKAKQAKEDVS
ncbi:DsbE family thiol:disulfide interchange protein [Paraferrimonas sedimenticola]|uniref:Thiol:disulfide interchange protein n=1 Tax=Paraferrimonas sedimenticola TaxID=375674 RepID=A0AA37W2K1_9GAMM|nr:DsbE family thiol:disulfide interchange protein [Paraferrimonas sedimenticola]GLP97708.1 thiol:disulfide interchange protein [Paraferrimonas sedimenticola]